jgi:alpha-beta hydrolase superfamily lysophospholipase
MSDSDEGYLGYYDPDKPASALAALHQLDAYITSNGPFGAIIAFSQGAQLAATYLVHKKLEDPSAPPTIKCAILFSPLGIYDPRDWIANGTVRRMSFEEDGYVLPVPSLIVWGDKDLQWRDESESMSRLADPRSSCTLVHAGGHEIPGIGLKEALYPVAKLAKRCILSAT